MLTTIFLKQFKTLKHQCVKAKINFTFYFNAWYHITVTQMTTLPQIRGGGGGMNCSAYIGWKCLIFDGLVILVHWWVAIRQFSPQTGHPTQFQGENPHPVTNLSNKVVPCNYSNLVFLDIICNDWE